MYTKFCEQHRPLWERARPNTPNWCVNSDQTVGASLLAMRSYQPPSMLPDTPPSRAGSLPQRNWRRTPNWRTTPTTVGAGLPAMRAAQSTLMSPDTPPSRASPLPQGARPNTPNWCVNSDQTVGASLLAMRSYQSPSMLPDTPPSRAGPLPQFPHLTDRHQGPAGFFHSRLSNLLSNTSKRDLIPAFHGSGTGNGVIRGHQSPATHPHYPLSILRIRLSWTRAHDSN
ncbi:hypothetical protein AB7M22_001680 [Pseudomonas sp. ADAK2 TE3594]